MSKEALNISIEGDLKVFIKRYAEDHNTSASHVIESYIKELRKDVVPYVPESPELLSLINIIDVDLGDVTTKALVSDSKAERFLND